MLRESRNFVTIEGTLQEVDINYDSFVDKNGIKKDTIRGSIKVKVNQEIEGEMKVLEVPVHMFSTKITAAGKENPAYISIEKVMTDMKSIAVVGEAEADKVRIAGAKIAMNEYYPQGDTTRLVSFPRVQASFVTRIKPEDCKERAIWEMEVYIGKMDFQTDKEGLETDTFQVTGVTVGYGDKVDVIPLLTRKENIYSGLQSTFEVGETVPMNGKLNFSSTTTVELEEVEIGDPIERIRTTSVSELIITGVKPAREEDEAYTEADIQSGLQDRTARLEANKARADQPKAGETKAPSAAGKPNLGF